MANCYNVNEEKSGPMNGWFCNVCGQSVDSDIYTNYCNDIVNCQYCPYMGGDDRIRNPEALTEEICYSIMQSVRFNMDRGICEIQLFLEKLCSLASQTQYEYLCRNIENETMRRISQPSLKGQIVDVVLTDIEKKRAENLEKDLNHMFWEIQPADFAAPISVSGNQLCVSSSDLQEIIWLIQNSSYSLGNAFDGNVDGEGISKYEDPVHEAQRELEIYVNGYMRDILSAVNEVKNTYECGCSMTFGSMGRMGLSAPGGPKWEI